MDGAHRKIDLQSPEDLTFLITNVRRAAAEHLSEAFPPVEGDDAGGDELRVRIEQIVDEVCDASFSPFFVFAKHSLLFCTPLLQNTTTKTVLYLHLQHISQTFTLAAPNLCINGFDLDAKTFPAVYLASPLHSQNAIHHTAALPEEIIQFEPFDARKRARVEELAREEEDLMREIAELKKTVPAATARQYAETFWAGLQGDQEGFEAAKQSVSGEEKEVEPEGKDTHVLLEGLGSVERRDDVEKGYRGVVETLGRLKREMPATVARMERARVAGEYVVTER